MKQKINSVKTEIGEIWGRDAIYLSDMKMINEMTFMLTGFITKPSEKNYSITFHEVHLFKMIELDFDTIPYKSAFDIIENSQKIEEMVKQDLRMSIGKIDHSYNHYVFRTYDSVFEIIGKNFELKLN